jgi:predicted double-glycine peptidase
LKRRIEAHICLSFTAYAVYKELERVLKEENRESRRDYAQYVSTRNHSAAIMALKKDTLKNGRYSNHTDSNN